VINLSRFLCYSFRADSVIRQFEVTLCNAICRPNNPPVDQQVRLLLEAKVDEALGLYQRCVIEIDNFCRADNARSRILETMAPGAQSWDHVSGSSSGQLEVLRLHGSTIYDLLRNFVSRTVGYLAIDKFLAVREHLTSMSSQPGCGVHDGGTWAAFCDTMISAHKLRAKRTDQANPRFRPLIEQIGKTLGREEVDSGK